MFTISSIVDIEFAVETYSDSATGKLDATMLGDVLRGLKLNPSLHTLEKLGQSKKPGKHSFIYSNLNAMIIFTNIFLIIMIRSK